ncbi:DoxX family protein [Fluviicola taffensis DSM 16823]|uniref:DoxX family protein n=2 Tax=Fluviicola TaxID=332102 RepID=F2I9J1_FLUTR|nr:DoxX family protein [Fluviicola taffensis DSM 16823]
MEILTQYNPIAAITIARVFLGILFLFQGYDAVFNIGLKKVTDTYQANFGLKGIPRNLTSFAAWYTSCTELICGLLLVLGLFEFASLYLLGINLIIAAIGFGLNAPLWDTKNVYPRLILLLFLLIVPAHWHHWSLDYLLFKPHML